MAEKRYIGKANAQKNNSQGVFFLAPARSCNRSFGRLDLYLSSIIIIIVIIVRGWVLAVFRNLNLSTLNNVEDRVSDNSDI